MRCATFLIALVCAGCAGPAVREEPRAAAPTFALPLGLAMGMTLAEAEGALTAAGATCRAHDDDKPFRDASVKLRVTLPVGAGDTSATLYFAHERLWRMKLRPGRAGCRALEQTLGPPAVEGRGCCFWIEPARLRGALRCPDICHFLDTAVWLEVGESREAAEAAFAGFAAEVDQARGHPE